MQPPDSDQTWPIPKAVRYLGLLSMLFLSSCAFVPALQPPGPPSSGASETQAEAPAAAEQPPPPAPADKESALRNWVDQQGRIYRVAAPLLINNTELCPQHARSILGFTAKNAYSYSRDFIDAARSLLGLGEELQVMNVLPGSGAEQAGIRKADVLVTVEIEPVPQGADAEHEAAKLIGSEMRGRSSLHLTVLRDGEHVAFDVPLTNACAMMLDLGNTDDASSFSDGHRVMITRGMLAFVQSDEELAYALAREIARNELMPSPRPEVAAVIDQLHAIEASAVSGSSAAAPAYPPDLEADADKVALYMLARAGYRIDNFPAFLQRLASLPSSGTGNIHAPLRSHEGDRLSAMDDAIRSIKLKQENGQPLVP